MSKPNRAAPPELSAAPPLPSYRALLGDRGLFPELDGQGAIYLNHGAISPTSVAVRKQVDQNLRDYAGGGVAAFMRWLPQKLRLKTRIAELLGAADHDARMAMAERELGFVQNTSAGVAQVAFGIPWEKGQRVLCFEGEFPANVTHWQRAADTFGLGVDFLPSETFRVDGIEAGLAMVRAHLEQTPTRLIAASLVEFQTGLRMPIERLTKLAHEFGAEVFTDAIQGLGMVPFSVRDESGAPTVDYLSCGGHKWLMGLQGLGFLYIAKERLDTFVPRLAGWLGHEEGLRFLFEGEGHLRYDRDFRHEANVVEQGAMSGVGAAALEVSLDLILQLGTQAIFDHVQSLHDLIEPAMRERGFESLRSPEPAARSGSLCFRPPAGVGLAELHQALLAHGVACTTPDGKLRLAPHWPNGPEQVAPLMAAVDAALARARG